MRLHHSMLSVLVLAAATASPALSAQAPNGPAPADPSARLREVLPPDVAARVLAVIADARAHGLADAALAQRALKFAARGIPAADIERSVAEQARRQARVQTLLASSRGAAPAGDEIEAGAEAMREGLDGHDVSALAKTAPSGRSLTIPLYVLGSLTSHGLASDQALSRVQQRLAAGASDADLEALPQDAAAHAGDGAAPGEMGRDVGAARRAGAAGASAPPAGVPANGAARGHAGGPPPHPGKP